MLYKVGDDSFERSFAKAARSVSGRRFERLKNSVNSYN